MKELSIEEKAQRYDEALATTRKLYNMRGDWTNLEIESIFPELAESEDERIKEKVITTIHLYYGEPLEDEAKEMIDWLEKQGEHTDIPAEWSEEDERDFDVIRGIIYNSCNAEDASRLLTWFKAIKDRVQPKQEWSEEDNHYLYGLIGLIEQSKAELPITLKGKAADNCIDWLKSLRPQSTWKPTEEHYKLEEFAKIVRCNLTGISKAVQELFEAKYLQLTGNKMYGGFED